LPKPIAQVQNDAGKIAGFGQTKQKTSDIELMCRLHEPGQRGNSTPGKQDARDPNTCPDLGSTED
jgi:hypothetical protein